MSFTNLNEFYQTLGMVSSIRNKYDATTLQYNLDYRIITGRDAYYAPIGDKYKQFIMGHKEVLALPNKYNGCVVGFLLRPYDIKDFRYVSEFSIPYGAGYYDKPYDKPWIIVESCLDADYLRQYYPYVIATLGVTISNALQDFVFNTAPYVYVGFDNDTAGDGGFKKMCFKHKGQVKKLTPPFGNKDFGDTLNHLYNGNMNQFMLEDMYIKTYLQSLI